VILSSACCFGGELRHLQSFGTILQRRGELLIRLAISVAGVFAAKPNPAGRIFVRLSWTGSLTGVLTRISSES
jgi:hypothetical protein